MARSVAAVRIPIALAALWTGALLAVSMLQLAAFDFAKPQVWFWMGAYAVFPLWGAALYFGAGAGRTAERRPADPALMALGIVCLALAAAMLFAPAAVIRAWPWALPPLLASIYAGPFFAYGVAALMLAREARPGSRRIVLASMLAFTLLVLLASLLHLKLFRFEGPSAWLWFGAGAAGAALLSMRLVGTRAR